MSRPLIIGQAPARGNDGKLPFAGKSGAKLARMAGVGESGDDLPRHFDLVNLVTYWPGKPEKGKGDNFPILEARIAAEKLRVSLALESPRYILMMGHKVKECMGFGDLRYLQSRREDGHVWIAFPHPSGVNRWYNDGVNVTKASRMLRMVVNHGG